MRLYQRLIRWLETRWVAPAYAGWLIAGLAIFFFGAATNTMAGWLYVMSGVMGAVLAIAALWPRQVLRDLEITRSPIRPVSQGEPLTLELRIENHTAQSKSLLQITDELPQALGQPSQRAIEQLPPNGLVWRYQQPTPRRGIFRWQDVSLRTAAPLGLFWGQHRWQLPAKAVVYPLMLPLDQCPLVDQSGQDDHAQRPALRSNQLATEGITRTLRPYRWGDSTRLIHWRSSARHGELRLRELEVLTGGQAIVIGLDTSKPMGHIAWTEPDFEQAVIAAASLYRYAALQGIPVSLWTAQAGLLTDSSQVLEHLAEVQPEGSREAVWPRTGPLIWLTYRPKTVEILPPGSRWLLWSVGAASTSDRRGRVIQPDEPLQSQLRSPLAP